MSETEALNWIAGIFDATPGSIAPETVREDIQTWDSMGVLLLMAGLDEKFSILMTDGDIAAMRRVDDILAVLRKHKKLDSTQ